VRKYFLALLIVFACSEVKVEKPENLMTREQMVAFLIDSHLTEGNLQVIRIDKDSLEVIFKQLEKELYIKHNIDSGQFTQSYHYYLHQPDQLSGIYDAVIDSLSLKEKMLNSGR
jgi:hypothetical protein